LIRLSAARRLFSVEKMFWTKVYGFKRSLKPCQIFDLAMFDSAMPDNLLLIRYREIEKRWFVDK